MASTTFSPPELPAEKTPRADPFLHTSRNSFTGRNASGLWYRRVSKLKVFYNPDETAELLRAMENEASKSGTIG